MSLSTRQKAALQLLQERDVTKPGVASTSSETYADRFNVWVHWRTAYALKRRGLVELSNWDPEFGEDITLTALGRLRCDCGCFMGDHDSLGCATHFDCRVKWPS